jgi:hypothetical protein
VPKKSTFTARPNSRIASPVGTPRAGTASSPQPATTSAQIETATQATWAILLKKWRTVSGGADLILDQTHPLGYWRKLMLEIHGIDLPGRP